MHESNSNSKLMKNTNKDLINTTQLLIDRELENEKIINLLQRTINERDKMIQNQLKIIERLENKIIS
jgi:hypothetical protein